MLDSVSGQYESKPVIGYQTGKMEISFPLGTTRLVPQKKKKDFPVSHIKNPLYFDQVYSVKMTRYIGLVLFYLHVYGPRSTSPPSINTQELTWPISSHLGFTWSITHVYIKKSKLKLIQFLSRGLD